MIETSETDMPFEAPPAPRKRRRGLYIATAIVLVGVVVLFAAWRSFARPPETVVVERHHLQEVLELSGVIEAARDVTLKAESTGRVVSLMVEENQVVPEGAPLLQIDPSQARFQLEQARSNMETSVAQAKTTLQGAQRTLQETLARHARDLAGLERQVAKSRETVAHLERELARSERLLAQGAITGQSVSDQRQQLSQARLDLQIAQDNLAKARAGTEVTSARNAVAQAQDTVKGAQEQGRLAIKQATDELTRTRVHAPFKGTLVDWQIAKGDYITPGSALAKFVDLEALKLVLPVDELDLPKFHNGMPISISFDAYPDQAFTGQVARVSPVSEASAEGVETFPVEATFANPGGRIRPGMSGDAKMVLSERRDVLAIPSRALTRQDGNPVVFVLAGRRPKPVVVEPGLATAEMVEIRSGLVEGEKVVLDPNAVGRRRR